MLKTEMRNSKTTHIDKMSSLEIVNVMQEENIVAVNSIAREKGNIAIAIDRISERMNKGGRLFYVGCGTSGRLGVLDASECPPTFGVDSDKVIGIIAGGDIALRNAIEGAEDDYSQGIDDIKKYKINETDSVLGISVAGGADYVVGALSFAREKGALTLSLSCNENSKIAGISDINIVTDTGAEVVTGSSRLKAGSAHKMILNMISTGVMIKLGRVYENYMIYLKPSNLKLKKRMISIVCDLLKCNEKEAEERLNDADWNIRNAVKE